MSFKGRLKRVSVWVIVAFCSPSASATGFDAPLDKQEVQTKKDKAKVTCFYFDQFMIKQIDAGEKGAERLSMTPLLKETFKPLCRAEMSRAEVALPQGREGYFKGVISHYVFFDDADGLNGATGFSAFDALSGKKIFEDFAEGELDFTMISSETVKVRYRRAYFSPCSVVTQGLSCWQDIRKELQLPAKPRPDCLGGYKTAKQALAQARCEASGSSEPRCLQKEVKNLADMDKSASVISYPVQITDLSNPVIKPVDGNLRCWPVD